MVDDDFKASVFRDAVSQCLQLIAAADQSGKLKLLWSLIGIGIVIGIAVHHFAK